MSEARDAILKKVRDALAPLEARTPYPDYDDSLTVSRGQPEAARLWDRFAVKIGQVNGQALEGLAALGTWLTDREEKEGYCDPRWAETVRPHLPAGVTLHTQFDTTELDRYAFGITEAAGAIAETGTLIFKDRLTSARLAALAPWLHIALVRPATVMAEIRHATATLGDDPSVIWATGPSKTADVEGILIEGVHGPGAQVGVLLTDDEAAAVPPLL